MTHDDVFQFLYRCLSLLKRQIGMRILIIYIFPLRFASVNFCIDWWTNSLDSGQNPVLKSQFISSLGGNGHDVGLVKRIIVVLAEIPPRWQIAMNSKPNLTCKLLLLLQVEAFIEWNRFPLQMPVLDHCSGRSSPTLYPPSRWIHSNGNDRMDGPWRMCASRHRFSHSTWSN